MSDDEMEVIEQMKIRLESNPRDVEALLALGQAYFRLEEYEAARDNLRKGISICGDDASMSGLRKKLDMWDRKCGTHLSEADTVFSAPTPAAAPAPAEAPAPAPAPEPAPAPPKPKLRTDWFQSHGAVTITLFVKNCAPHDVETSVSEQSIHVSIRLPDESTETWAVRKLFGKVTSGSYSVEVKSMKIDIRLTKQEQGSWDALEAKEDTPVQKPSSEAKPYGGGAFPKGAKKQRDWANFQVDDEEEKPEGDAALNKLFQDIYSKGDDTTRQAMCKSFTESAGTVLSTNWSEVGSKKVEGSAPNGMVMKDWGTHEKKEHT